MNKRTVVKVGGAGLVEPQFVDSLVEHVSSLVENGHSVAVVHGGGVEIGELHERLGLVFRKELGLRVTSDEGMDIVTMVLCGLANKRLVAKLNSAGLSALGVSGADLGLLKSSFLNRERLGRVGGPPEVDGDALERLFDTAPVLVIAPVSMGPDGALLNVNADVAAQTIAVALGVTSLDFVTDVEGVKTADGSVERLNASQVNDLIRNNIVTGGMIPKLQASLAALDGGVECVRVGNLTSLRNGSATEVHP